ncbi:hypothetical protein BGZ65_011613, partial [Modicella reniformis]
TEQGGVRRRQGFETQLLSQPDPGPQAAEMDVEESSVGIDVRSRLPVTFQNEDLVASLFPENYIFGHSSFRLAHQKESLRRQAPPQEPQQIPQFIQQLGELVEAEEE